MKYIGAFKNESVIYSRLREGVNARGQSLNDHRQLESYNGEYILFSGRWRYDTETKKLSWTDEPTLEQKHSVENIIHKLTD